MVPANILDYLAVFALVFCVRLVFVYMWLAMQGDNLLHFLSFAVWVSVPFLAQPIVGDRGSNMLFEYFVSFLVFVMVLSAAQQWFLLMVTTFTPVRCHAGAIRITHLVFLGYHLDMAVAIFVLCWNVLITLLLIVVEGACCLPLGLHSWWLLNKEVANTSARGASYTPAREVRQTWFATASTSAVDWLKNRMGGSRRTRGQSRRAARGEGTPSPNLAALRESLGPA